MLVSDLHVLISSFIGVMIAEVIVKPVAIRTGRHLLRKADDKLGFIPDWLSGIDESSGEGME